MDFELIGPNGPYAYFKKIILTFSGGDVPFEMEAFRLYVPLSGRVVDLFSADELARAVVALQVELVTLH